jgi:hypothetical protein
MQTEMISIVNDKRERKKIIINYGVNKGKNGGKAHT